MQFVPSTITFQLAHALKATLVIHSNIVIKNQNICLLHLEIPAPQRLVGCTANVKMRMIMLSVPVSPIIMETLQIVDQSVISTRIVPKIRVVPIKNVWILVELIHVRETPFAKSVITLPFAVVHQTIVEIRLFFVRKYSVKLNWRRQLLIHVNHLHVDLLRSVGYAEIKPFALVSLAILEVLPIVDRNVLFTLIAHMKRLVFEKSVWILVLELVDLMRSVRSLITVQSAFAILAMRGIHFQAAQK